MSAASSSSSAATGRSGDSPSGAIEAKIAAVEAKVETAEAKVATLEAEVALYKAFPSLAAFDAAADLGEFEAFARGDRARQRNALRLFLDGDQPMQLARHQQQLVELQGTLKELQHEKNALREEKARGKEEVERDAKRRRVGDDNSSGAAFSAACLSAARSFVAEHGPEAAWDELSKDLPDLPVGSVWEEGWPGACGKDVGKVTHDIASFVGQGKTLAEGAPGGEVKTDAALGALYAACRSVSASHSSFNLGSPASVGAGSKSTRPDTRVTVRGFDIVRGESKSSASDLEVAAGEITTKMRPWSAAYYGDLPGILGIACAGHRFRAVFVARAGGARVLAEGSLGTATDAIKLARLAIAAVAYARVRAEDEGWGQKSTGVVFRTGETPPRVDKTYADARPALANFYSDTEGVPGLERGVKHEIDGEPRLFYLTPVGCSRVPHRVEARTAMRQIAETVAALHGKGWAHRDLRWPNVVLDCTREGRRWTVIDCEYAAIVGTPWADSHPPDTGFREDLKDPIRANDDTVSVQRDHWMLGRMVAGLEEGLDDAELAEIGIRLRAAPGETYASDEDANAARARAFADLRRQLTS